MVLMKQVKTKSSVAPNQILARVNMSVNHPALSLFHFLSLSVCLSLCLSLSLSLSPLLSFSLTWQAK